MRLASRHMSAPPSVASGGPVTAAGGRRARPCPMPCRARRLPISSSARSATTVPGCSTPTPSRGSGTSTASGAAPAARCRASSRRAVCRRSAGSPAPWSRSAARSPVGWSSSGDGRRRGPASPAGCGMAFERLGSSYVKLGQIISGGEGLFPDELVTEFKLLRDQVPPEPFADVRAVVEIDLGGSLERAVRVVRRDAHRGRLDRPGARRPAPHRRGGRGEGAAAPGRAALPRRHRRPLVARAPARRPDPRRRAGQPTGPGGAVRGDRHRGARLPPRGAEHARHRARAGRDRPARDHRAPPAPDAGHASGCW